MVENINNPPKKLSKKERAKAQNEKKIAELKKIEEEKQEKIKKAEQKKLIPFNNKVNGLLLVLIGFFLLTYVGLFLFLKVFDAKSLSELLPAKSTVAFTEMDLKNDHLNGIFDKLKNSSSLSKQNLIKKIEQFLDSDFESEIEPWISEKIGVALLNLPAKAEKSDLVYFISYKNKKDVLAFLDNLKINNKEQIKEENFSGRLIYEYAISQSFRFTFVDRYLVMSNSKEALKEIISNLNSPDKTVRKSDQYIETANNLSINRFAFGYVNMAEFVKVLSQQNFLNNLTEKINFLKPFMSIFSSLGATAAFDGDGIIMQTYTPLIKSKMSDVSLLRGKQKYQGNFLNIVKDDASLLWGGFGLDNQIKRFLKMADNIYPDSGALAEAALRGQVNKFLGDTISLENDIYPLLANEFMFTFWKPTPPKAEEKPKEGTETPLPENSVKEDNGAKFLVMLNIAGQEKKMEALIASFLNQKAFILPEVKEITDDKGNKNFEISAKEGQIQENKTKYLDYTISEINFIIEQPYRLFFTKTASTFFISNDSDKIKATLAMIGKENAESIKNNENIYLGLTKVMAASDEIVLIKSDLLKDKFNFVPADTISYWCFGQNAFDDGMSSIHYLHFK